jgi:hypothetical protein
MAIDTDVWRMVPSRQRPLQPSAEMDVSEIVAGGFDDGYRLIVPVRNVGAGVARLVRAAASYERQLTPQIHIHLVDPPSVVAPGETVRLLFRSGEEFEPVSVWLDILLRADEPLLVEIAYLDVVERQQSATLIVIRRNEKGRYVVRDVRLLAGRNVTLLPFRQPA